VESAHPEPRLAGAPVDAPLRVRVLPRDDLPCSGRGLALTAEARPRVARDVAADVAELLASGATVAGAPLRPGDVAVLVRTNDQGTLLRDALAVAGVPAVLSGATSVFGTPSAREWLTLLHALEQPRPVRIRDVALTCFLGRTVAELCGDDADALLDELGATLRRWAAVLHGKGVAALLEAVTTGTGLPGRLLGVADGERRLTDVRHIGQALHAAAVDAHLGPAALVEWLRHRIDEAAVDVGLERSRRLDSDAAAVQIITVHRSKGLEFPVVYVPFGWDRYVPREPDVPLLHDDAGTRILDVGGPGGPRWPEHCARHEAEEAGEDLRLLYVALTRARCQVVTWWVPATTTPTSPLHRLLFGRRVAGATPPASCPVPNDTAALTALQGLAGADLAVERVGEQPRTAFRASGSTPPSLAVARFTRSLDIAWRRTSYSALTAGAHGGPVGVVSEPDVRQKDDEGQAETDDDAFGAGPAAATTTPDGAGLSAPDGPAVPSPMADLPVGTGFGTLVHAVFETADLTAPDLRAELLRCVRTELDHHPTPAVDPDGLADALVPVACTPLGPLAGDQSLADLAPADRLAELDFELPLAGGDDPGADVRLGDLVPLLRRLLPADDPLAAYPDRLAPLAAQPLRGYLTGSIDAVLRLRDPERYAVVDYKTNWLGPIGADGPEPLLAAHYTPTRLAAAMMDAHYPLQALLYSAALHRFLRWRLRDYDPERHLGGVLYLFLRGMCGPDGPVVGDVPCGVFSWRPPAVLVTELSDLLDRGAAR
jgi:exodeoxyribonuclease V beta subunit